MLAKGQHRAAAQPMQQVQVQVPAGIRPGQQFLIQIGAQQMNVACPQGVGPGQMIIVSVPIAGGAPAAPPPPQPGSPEHLFGLIDVDRSGALNAQELQKALSGGSMQVSDSELGAAAVNHDDDWG